MLKSKLDKINPITGLSLRDMRKMSEIELSKFGIERVKKPKKKSYEA